MYYFIVNPNSRAGNGYRVWKKVERVLQKTNTSFQVYYTEGPQDARKFANILTNTPEMHPNSECVIVVLGGDGTLNEVLDGLCFNTSITLGFIPTGSGNDFRRSLHLPKRPTVALKHILNPKYHANLDYGVLTCGEHCPTHRRFAISTGIGYDAAVCADPFLVKYRCALRRIFLNKLSYIITGIRQICKLKPSDGYIILDGVKKIPLKKIAFISSHIHRYEGGGFIFAPTADSSDGMLDICVISNVNRLKIIPILFMSIWGKHTNMRGVHIYRCREATVHTEKSLPVHTDGESNGNQTDFNVVCVEKRLRVIL